MISYWLMFSVPAFASLGLIRATPKLQGLLWFLVGVLFALILGLRYEVGGDWGTYLRMYQHAPQFSLVGIFAASDPAYALLNIISKELGGGVYLVNSVCAVIVVGGVCSFSLRQPMPWVALVVAVPYILIVVAMGYTRQGTAMGFEFLALVALSDGKLRKFVFLVVCAALFHKSAVVLLPLMMLVSSTHRFWAMVWSSVATLLLSALIILGSYESLWRNYVEVQLVSDGGPIRVVMNAVPAVLFLLFRNRFALEEDERRLWSVIAVSCLICIPLVGVASVAVDRIALYLMPIQLYVLSRIHWLFEDRFLKTLSIFGVIVLYGLVQWVWLNFASNSGAWTPYNFLPFRML